MSAQTIGYIVTSEGHPLWEERRAAFPDSRGVLYFSKAATMFASREAARRAIVRSREYAAANNLPWNWEYGIVRVEARHV